MENKKETTIKELAKLHKMAGSTVNTWILKSGVKPIRTIDTGKGIPTNVYSLEEIEKANILQYSNRVKFKEADKKKEMIELICSELGIKSSTEKTEKELFEDAVIDLLCRIDENLKKLADALGGSECTK